MTISRKRATLIAIGVVAVAAAGWILGQRLLPDTPTSSTGYAVPPDDHTIVALDSFAGKSVQDVYTEIGYPGKTDGKYRFHIVGLDPAAAANTPADQIIATVCGGYLTPLPADIWLGVYPRSSVTPDLATRITAHDNTLKTDLRHAAPTCPDASTAISAPAG
ncbi:hypothetical protein [Nocardia terpenica]|nr:hypothetical protein [Nocardia terpenica]NQE88729.1 hypothetical protein [Nocardia terpenica]